MQLLATLDLRDKKLDVQGVAMVFVDSYYELDFGDREAIAFRVVDDANLEATPVTEPPEDYVEEPFPEGEETRLVLAELEDDAEIGDEDSYVGGEPIWPEETGAPEEVPSGRFLMRLFNLLPSPMTNSAIFVFEDGAAFVPQYDEDEEEQRTPWTAALSSTRELVVVDEAPASAAIAKFGGAPRMSGYNWPKDSRDRPLTHLMTLGVESFEPANEDTVALAYFVDRRRAALEEWAADTDLIVVEEISREEYDDTEEHELPEGVELLEARALELRPFEGLRHWRQLLGRSFIGPRAAHHNLQVEGSNDSVLQLEASFLPGVSRSGTLYLAGGFDVSFEQPGDFGSSDPDPYEYEDYGDYDDEGEGEGEDGEGSAAPLPANLRILRRGGSSNSFVGGLPPDIGLANWPRFENELMTHVMTLACCDSPDLSGARAAAYSVFLSTAMHHQAFGPDTPHAAVIAVSAEQLARRSAPPAADEALEVLTEHPVSFEVPEAGATSRPSSYVGGQPRWIQSPQPAGHFLAQADEDLIDVNLGDCGTLYIFSDTAFFQCG